MTLRLGFQLVVMADDGEMCIEKVVVLDKAHERLEHIGLSLAGGQGAPGGVDSVTS